MAKLLDQVRDAARTRHYSIRTEDAYVRWIREFILFHGKRHPLEMGEPEVGRFLTYLAVDRHVAASVRHQARAALAFRYKVVPGHPSAGGRGQVVGPRTPARLSRKRDFLPIGHLLV